MASVITPQTPTPLPHLRGTPAGVRHVIPGSVPASAMEIRSFLAAEVAASGGHRVRNLDRVEVVLALHRVLDVEASDVPLLDPVHHGYVLKLLPDQRVEFETLRQAGGLSGSRCRATGCAPVAHAVLALLLVAPTATTTR
jgi:deoxyxylulose-5-phosphate synthase